MKINQNDVANIEAAIKDKGNIWENPKLDDFKRKIKDYYRSINNECCYCKKNFVGEFNMVIDIEHVLPKSKFKDLMFAIYNLNIACKRCNMNIKRERTDFLVGANAVVLNTKDSSEYKIIHPNFDQYHEHIEYFSSADNQKKIIKYKVIAGSKKGQFTFDYFKLQDLEIDTINQAQGLGSKQEFSENIPVDIAQRLENIFKTL